MKPFRIGRRFVLRGLGGIGIALPLLDVMQPLRRAAAQAAAAPPKRFVAMYTPNGTIYNSWKPTGSGTSFTLSPILMPLGPYQSSLVVVDGLVDKAAQAVSGDDHQKGMTTNLTGIEPLPGPGGTSTNVGLSSGLSVDQAIANQIGQSTAFRSLELGVQVLSTGSALSYMAFSGSGQGLPAQDDPAATWKRVFGSFMPPSAGGGTGGTTAGAAAAKLLAERKSVLDAAMDSYTALLPRVSADDRVKLQAHLDRIRDLEGRLAQMSTSGGDTGSGGGAPIAACAKPAAPATLSYKQSANMPKVAQLQMDLLAMALACDLTRVATVQFGHESSDAVMGWVDPGITRGHHTMSHDADSVAQTQAYLVSINAWFAQQFAYLIGLLEAIPDGNGTMLDSSLLVWVNGLAKGNSHSHAPMPIVTAGGAGGSVAGGRFLTYAKTNTNNFLLACLNAMGGQATTFGNPAYCSGPLAGFLT